MTGATGATGATGPTGPAGADANDAACACVAQMRYVLSQIIAYYPNDVVVVNMESGTNVSGRPQSIYPNAASGGLFLLANNQGVTEEALSICRIAAVRVTSAAYNNALAYLPAPAPLPSGCAQDCQSAVRAYLPVGTSGVSIQAGGQTVAQGTVYRSEYGMLVITGNGARNPAFVSACKAEVLDK